MYLSTSTKYLVNEVLKYKYQVPFRQSTCTRLSTEYKEEQTQFSSKLQITTHVFQISTTEQTHTISNYS